MLPITPGGEHWRKRWWPDKKALVTQEDILLRPLFTIYLAWVVCEGKQGWHPWISVVPESSSKGRIAFVLTLEIKHITTSGK